MKNILRTVPIRKLHRNDLDTERNQQSGKSCDAGNIGSKTSAGKERLTIEPKHVTRLCGSIAVERAKKRHVPRPEGVCESGTFAAARAFSHLKNDSTTIRNQYLIVRIKRVQTRTVICRKVENLGPGFCHKTNEPGMMG